MFNFRKLQNQDLILIILVSLLSVIGLITVFTTTYYRDLEASQDFKQQLMFFLVGILVYLAITALDSSFLNQPKIQVVLVIITTIMLIALLIFGERISGTKRWFTLAGISFQPSEFAKLVVILSTAATFASLKNIHIAAPFNIYKSVKKREWREILMHPYIRRFAWNILGILMLVSLIWAQPSLGNALTTFTLWLMLLITMVSDPFQLYAYGGIFLLLLNIMFNFVNLTALYDQIGFSFYAGRFDLVVIVFTTIITLVLVKILRLRFFMITLLILAAVTFSLSLDFVWNNVISGYQQDRVIAFLNPDADPLGAQWQVTQAKIAIGSGQIFGKGFLNGTQSNLGLLPFAYTDFAYAAFTEQFGLVGSVLMLGLFYALIFRIFQISSNAEDNFGRIVCIGVALMLSLNIMVNVGMNLGIMPVTGVPLPFVSYGGSAVLVNFIGLGLVQMVHSEFGDKSYKAEKLLAPSH
jgi:rod shape determining protein RodA